MQNGGRLRAPVLGILSTDFLGILPKVSKDA
jgi:hypothetical protein